MKRTFRELLTEAQNALKAAGVPDAKTDAWLLFQECFGLDRGTYLMKADEPVRLSGQEAERFASLVRERGERVPLQQIVGETEFMGFPFFVNENVLIPRQDTETLAELVLKDTEGKSGLSLLDLCTGSGCLAVSLALLGPFSRVAASDVSEEALKVARENAERNHVRAEFTCGDLFAPVEGRFDVIVSNPPYIPRSVIAGLEPEVRDHEPLIALDGGEDGLSFYRRIAAEAMSRLNPGGRLYLEIGYDQAASVGAILSESGFFRIRTVQDLSGNDRVVCAETGGCTCLNE